MRLISVLHPYLESRKDEIDEGKYPKHHLWGVDALEELPNIKVNYIKSSDYNLPKFIVRILNKILFQNNSCLQTELTAIKASKTSDLIYSVSGPFGLSRFHNPKCKQISWVFRIPEKISNSPFHPYSPKNLSKTKTFFV